MMGFLTLCITMSWKVKAVAWLGGDPAHVLILIPFSVFLSVQFVTRMPFTSFSSGYFPRLPILLWMYKHVKIIETHKTLPVSPTLI